MLLIVVTVLPYLREQEIHGDNFYSFGAGGL